MKGAAKPRIVVFSRFSKSIASSRLRYLKYVPYWQSQGFPVLCQTLFDEEYVKIVSAERKSKLKLLSFVIRAYCSRIFFVLTKVRSGDIAFIQYEMLPYFPIWLEVFLKKKGVKVVTDYDDAWWHHYDTSSNKIVKFLFKKKVQDIIRLSDGVVTGSPYLTSFVSERNSKVIEIPTSIEGASYSKVHSSQLPSQNFVVGWIGSTTTSVCVDAIIKPVRNFLISTGARLKLIGYSGDVSKFEGLQVELIEWDEESETRQLQEISVGIMPLPVNPFTLGKCGFKLIQYMASGKPTISTPLEANMKIDGGLGNLFASTEHEWQEALFEVYRNYYLYAKIGEQNRQRALKEFSIEQNYGKYTDFFTSISGL